MKSRTSLFVIGIIIAMLAASLLTVLALFMTGVISTNKIELEFTVGAVEAKEYDGTPLRATSYVFNSGKLKEGHYLEVKSVGSQLNCGTSESDLLIKIYDEKNKEVTDEYSVKVNKGELTVTPKPITILLRSQQIPYSGKEIPIECYEVYKGNNLIGNPDDFPKGELVEGHKLVISFPGKFENVGDELPPFSEWEDDNFKIYDAAGNVVTSNYSLQEGFYGNSNIEIVPRRIKVKVLDAEKYYDGTPLEPRYELISGSLAEGQFIGEAEFVNEKGENLSVVKVGDSTNAKVSSILIYKQEGFDLVPLTDEEMKNYVLEGGAEVFGALTVKRRPVTVTAKDFVKIYDGQPLSGLLTGSEKPYITDLPEGFTLDAAQANLNMTDVCDGVYTVENITIREGSRIVTDQFAITKHSGIARITPISIRSGINSPQSVTYDGTEKEISVSEALDGVLAQSINAYVSANQLKGNIVTVLNSLAENRANYFKAVCTKTVKNAGTYYFTAELTEAGIDLFGGKADNAIFEFPTAKFEIGKAEIEQVTYKGTNGLDNYVRKVYDGKEANLDYRNLSLAGAENLAVSSADFRYGDQNNHAVLGNYTVSVNNIQIVDTVTSENVTQNYNILNMPTVNVEISRKSLYAVVGQAYLTYEVDSEPTNEEGISLAGILSQQLRSSVSFQGLAEGDSVNYEEFDLSGNYDPDSRTVTLVVSLDRVRNSAGEDVTNCYNLDNDGEARITVQIVVRGA